MPVEKEGAMTSTDMTLVVDNLRFPEGNRWHEDALWYADMHTGEVFRLGDVASGKPELVTKLEGQSSGMGWVENGDLIVSAMNQRKVLRVTPSGEQSVYADLTEISSSLINDLVLDKETGRSYVGAFGYDLYNNATPTTGPLYCVEPDGSARLAADGFVFPNSANILPETRTLVLGETWGGVLTAFDIDDDGDLVNRRTWAELEPGITPDGSCVDLEGGIWISSLETGEFQRVTEGGTVTDRFLNPGRHAVDCVLGGSAGTTLFLSTADSYIPEITVGTRQGWIQAVEVSVPGPVDF
jgi:sugar lactone lactonase YvrE